MSQPLTSPATRWASTTYGQLTYRAACSVGRAGVELDSDLPTSSPGDPAEVAAALQDVAAALAHLGTVLRSGTGSATTGQRNSRAGRDARLIAALQRVGRARDWEESRPTRGAAADLDRAAVLIRCAADLWSTHHGADGGPRSPEAARMRHPAMRGAATRHWRCLVSLAAQVADAIDTEDSGGDDAHGEPASKVGFPRPADDPRAGAGGRLLPLTVARPALPAGHPPIVELAGRAERLKRQLWHLARSGDVPAAVHINAACMADAVHGAAAAAHERAAAAAPEGPVRRGHLAGQAEAQRGQANWQQVRRLLRFLRTPHALTHPIQVERLDLERLVGRVLAAPEDESPDETGWELSRIARVFDELAAYSSRAIQSDHERGQVLLAGKAIPAEALPRRPDLLQARLRDCAVVAPPISMSRLQAAYDSVARPGPTGTAPPASPPAA